MSVVAGVVLWYGAEPENLAVQVLVDAPYLSVSEIYIEATFAEDLDSGHDTVEFVAPAPWPATPSRRVRVSRHYYGPPGSKPHLEVKVTSGETKYDVTVMAGTGPMGIQLDPLKPMQMEHGKTGFAIVVDQVEAQQT